MKFFLKTILLFSLLLTSGVILGQEHQKVSFGICTDAHLNLMHDAEERLTAFIDAMKERKPDFIIELGDFFPPDKKYNSFYNIWNSFPGEKYHVIGNHEPDGGFTWKQVLEDRGMENPYYAFEKNGFRFIVLDCNNKQHPDEKPYFNFVGPEQIEWLKAELSETRLPVVVFSHQALFSPKGNENMGVKNTSEIQSIFENHNRKNPQQRVIACFNGHTHLDIAEKQGGIWYITINSLSYNWLGGDYTHVRYSKEVDEAYPYIKYTAPYKDPLFTVAEISTKGTIKMEGKKTEWVGPPPGIWDIPMT